MKLLSGLSRLRGPCVLVAGLGAAFVGWGCSVEPPSADTSTNFVLSIPVADDSTRVDELVADRDDFLQIDDATGGMTVRVALPLPEDDAEPEILGSAEVGQNLRVTPQSNSFSTAIGQLSIPGQTIPEITVGLGALLGVDIEPGTTVPAIPATTFDTSVPLPLVGVNTLSIDSGGLTVDVTNDLPVDLENVVLSLVDQDTGTAIDQIDLGALPGNGGSASGGFDLGGTTISGDLSVAVTGGTQTANDVEVAAGDELRVNAELQTLLVSQATAVIPQQEFADSQVLEFPDDRIQVTEAVMSEGAIGLAVTNNIPIIMEVELTLPDLLDAQGEAQSFLIDSLYFGQPREITFDLTDNTFAPVDPLQMRVQYRARTFDSDTEVTIASDGTIDVQAITEEMVFSRVQGRLNQVVLEVPEEQEGSLSREIEFPAGLDNVAIGTAGLDVHLTSAVGFLADVSLLFEGVNDAGERGSLLIRETFERGDPEQPRGIVLNVSSAQLTDFINLLPTSITVSPVIIVGDGQQEEIIESDHYVNLDSVVFRTEPRFTVLADTRIDPDVEDISFRDSETRSKIATNFVNPEDSEGEGTLVVTEIESSIPLGVGVRLFAAHRRDEVYTNPSVTIPPLDEPPFQVRSAPVDANGLSAGTVTETDTLSLTRDQVLEFILEDDPSDSLFSGVRVTLPPSDGEVEVRAADFVNVIAGLRIELRLDENLVD